MESVRFSDKLAVTLSEAMTGAGIQHILWG